MDQITIIPSGSYKSRNEALDQAVGQYVYFEEEGVSLSENALKKMYQAMQPKLKFNADTAELSAGSTGMTASGAMIGDGPTSIDLVTSGYRLTEDGEGIYESPEDHSRVVEREDMLSRLLYPTNDQTMLWNKLFRRSIIEHYHIRFPEDIYYGGELVFLVTYMLHAYETRHMWDRLATCETTKMRDWPAEELFPEDASSLDEAMTEEELSRAAWQLHERTVTEVEAWNRIRKSLRRYPDARWLADQSMAYLEMTIYYQMLEGLAPEDADSFYRKSPLRKFASKARRLDFAAASEEDQALLESMIRFGKTGKMN